MIKVPPWIITLDEPLNIEARRDIILPAMMKVPPWIITLDEPLNIEAGKNILTSLTRAGRWINREIGRKFHSLLYRPILHNCLLPGNETIPARKYRHWPAGFLPVAPDRPADCATTNDVDNLYPRLLTKIQHIPLRQHHDSIFLCKSWDETSKIA